jgi:hypothetical protein
MNCIAALWADMKTALIDRFTLDAVGLSAKLAKVEAAIERAIDKETRKLLAYDTAYNALRAKKVATDAALNASYKLLHNVSSLTA